MPADLSRLVEEFEKAILSHREIFGRGPRHQAFLRKQQAKQALLAAIAEIAKDRDDWKSLAEAADVAITQGAKRIAEITPTPDEWALLQTLRLDFCKHYCDLSGHVSGCIASGKIMEKWKPKKEAKHG